MKNLSDDDDQPKDFVGLWSQLDDISDPIVRKEVSSRLWSENFAAAKEDVRIDPVNALNQMVEGKSGYTDRFVEESLLIWMQQDRNACMSWYNQKWGNLSKEKAQDVAAAMARYAVGTRDLDAARQWLPHIYDDAIKNRIEGFINHVENAKEFDHSGHQHGCGGIAAEFDVDREHPSPDGASCVGSLLYPGI